MIKAIFGCMAALTLFTAVTCLSGAKSETPGNGPSVADQPRFQDLLYTNAKLTLPESFSLFDNYVSHSMTVSIFASLSNPLVNATYLSSYLFMEPLNITATATYRDIGQTRVQPVIVPMGYGESAVLYFYFDQDLTDLNITIHGRLDGLSLIWRNMLDVIPVAPAFSVPIAHSFRLEVEASKAIEVTSIDSPSAYELDIEKTLLGENTIYSSTLATRLIIYYRPEYWQSAGIVAIAVATIALALAGVYADHVLSRIPRAATPLKGKIEDFIHSKLSSETLLTSFVLCSLLMISLGLIAGPDPRIKIYTISTPSTASFIETSLGSELGPVQIISPVDTVSEFETMANLGIVRAVVISDYPGIALDRVVEYVLEPLRLVPVIVIDEAGADPGFASTVKERYGDKVLVIQGIKDISSSVVVRRLNSKRRSNALGLPSELAFYKAVSTIIAVLSFVEAFVGLAFLSSRLIESGRNRRLWAIAEAIVLSALVFYFTQAIYVSSSVLLAMPIGLHAVTSGSKEITVVGLLGFGGGSTPRALAGLMGILVGAYARMKSDTEIDRFGFIAFAILVMILALDPFTGGTLLYDSLLFFLSGPRTEIIRTSIYYTKDILSEIAALFGAWVSPIYGISTGEMLFYAAAIPIFLFPSLKRSSATLLIFMCSIGAGSGFIRTAEMTPFKTVASLVPGVVMGLALVTFFSLISLAESYLRTRLTR